MELSYPTTLFHCFWQILIFKYVALGIIIKGTKEDKIAWEASEGERDQKHMPESMSNDVRGHCRCGLWNLEQARFLIEP